LLDANIAGDGNTAWGCLESWSGHKRTSLLVLSIVRRLYTLFLGNLKRIEKNLFSILP
jgi:hypothetical protein